MEGATSLAAGPPLHTGIYTQPGKQYKCLHVEPMASKDPVVEGCTGGLSVEAVESPGGFLRNVGRGPRDWLIAEHEGRVVSGFFHVGDGSEILILGMGSE